MAKLIRLSCKAHADGRLSGGGQLSNTEAAVTTVANNEQRVVFEEAVFPTLLERTAYVDRTRLSGRRAGRSHQPGTALVLVRS